MTDLIPEGHVAIPRDVAQRIVDLIEDTTNYEPDLDDWALGAIRKALSAAEGDAPLDPDPTGESD